jgi:cytochrome P450 family 709
VQISGYTIPKGTTIMLPAWALHRNKLVWGKDADKWNPDRWLQGNSVAAARKDSDGNARWLPFMEGVSNCIGQHLAMVRPRYKYTRV